MNKAGARLVKEPVAAGSCTTIALSDTPTMGHSPVGATIPAPYTKNGTPPLFRCDLSPRWWTRVSGIRRLCWCCCCGLSGTGRYGRLAAVVLGVSRRRAPTRTRRVVFIQRRGQRSLPIFGEHVHREEGADLRGRHEADEELVSNQELPEFLSASFT
jgi:hypothetical protein